METRLENARLADAVFGAVMKMFLRDNFIHGDLHGGNVIRSGMAPGAHLTIIDAGVVTAIAPAVQPRFHQFLRDLCLGRPVAPAPSAPRAPAPAWLARARALRAPLTRRAGAGTDHGRATFVPHGAACRPRGAAARDRGDRRALGGPERGGARADRARRRACNAR